METYESLSDQRSIRFFEMHILRFQRRHPTFIEDRPNRGLMERNHRSRRVGEMRTVEQLYKVPETSWFGYLHFLSLPRIFQEVDSVIRDERGETTRWTGGLELTD